MILLLISSHILDCNSISIPDDAIIRVNLAWVESFSKAYEKISKIKYKIFLDNPTDRKKAPCNKYTLNQINELICDFSNIKYLAVSNIESKDDLIAYKRWFNKVSIIPKIESIKGITNIDSIAECLSSKIIMLDHDDLCSDIISKNICPSKLYMDFIDPFLINCKNLNVEVLRTQGVIFSTEN